MEFVVWLILSFAAYRITRFLVIDSFFEVSRAKFYTFLANRRGKLQFFWQKLLYLSSCTFCLGFWISLIVYSLYLGLNPLDFTRIDWINVFAVAAVQSLIHVFEPADSE